MPAPVPFSPKSTTKTQTRRPSQIFEELAIKLPHEFGALVVLAQAALDRLRDSS